jgi:inositol phosphorylceramide mannosyltransferase catalytic subunit
MPEAFRRFAEGWQRLHPDWTYRLWGGGDLPPLRNQDLYDRADELCPGFEGQLRSDVVRYELLHRFGGVWVDVDFECLKPLDELLQGVDCFAAWEIQGRVANNAILGCRAGHPFMAKLIENLPASVLSGDSTRPSKISGPWYLTAQLEPDVTLFDQRLFYPYACTQLGRAGETFPAAYAVHHWHNQRRLRRKPL